jgi:uncharacterized delta-60 repeat protein
MNRFITILTALLTQASITASAQVLDNTFGTNGLVITTPQVGEAIALARQADGKIVTAGRVIGDATHQFEIIRYNNDGSLDNGFGINGIVITQVSFLSTATAIAIQPDGKIVAAGTYHTGDFANIYHMVVARYHANGNIDSTFGTNGLAMPEPGFSEEINDMVLQPDGKIIVAGTIANDMPVGAESFMLARFTSNGTLDTGFGASGITTTSVNISSEIVDIALLPDGKIIAAGRESLYDNPPVPDHTNFAIARYTPQGMLDSTFGTNGIVVTDVATGAPDILQSMVVQPDGKIVAAGASGNNHCLVRYQSNGSLDNTFGTSGKVIKPGPPAVLHLALRSNGKFITAGTLIDMVLSADFMLNGYLPNGAIDTGFGLNGTVMTNFPTAIPEGANDLSNCILVTPDNKIVVAGSSDMNVALARYTFNDGTSVNSPQLHELAIEIAPNPFQNTVNLNWKGSDKIMNGELYLVNMLGQRVFSRAIALKKGSNKIGVPNLAQGNYILLITTDDGKNLSRKITKQ